MKQIHVFYLNRIAHCFAAIFDAQDDDFVDGRRVSANERAIDHWLDKAGITDEEDRRFVCEVCDAFYDPAIESPMTKRLEAAGWKVLVGKENLC